METPRDTFCGDPELVSGEDVWIGMDCLDQMVTASTSLRYTYSVTEGKLLDKQVA